MSGLALEFRIVVVFVINLQEVFHTRCVGIVVIILLAKFPHAISSGPLFLATRLKAKEHFGTDAILLFFFFTI